MSEDDRALQTFPKMLTAFLPEIQRALPEHLTGERMARIALTAFRRQPKLGQCDPRSVFAAVIQASQLGLEPDMQGRAFLVPYGKECQFVPGWKGLLDLLHRSGQGTAWTGVVYAGDEVDYVQGDTPRLSVKSGGEYRAEKITHAYAIGAPKGSEYKIIELWPAERIVEHRNRYNKMGDRHYSFKHWEMYARKVVLLQVLKYMPASAELSKAIALNDAAEIGAQHLTIKDAIEGTWAPVADDNVAAEEATQDTQNKARATLEAVREQMKGVADPQAVPGPKK
jgi:recombination protein RecT